MEHATGRPGWIARFERLLRPMLEAAAAGRLDERMPCEGRSERAPVRRLEAVGRGLAGLAPWLECAAVPADERALQTGFRDLARAAIAVQVDPSSADAVAWDGSVGNQPLVDAAFLAHALLRAPTALLDGLDATVRERLVTAFVASRAITPPRNNWLLFAAMVEAALDALGHAIDHDRVDDALRSHQEWYAGDGTYGDGAHFHWDYYNGFVIQPMLLDVLAALGDRDPEWAAMAEPVARRATRYAAIQERLIAADGSWPVLGRSIAYRCGAFQHLAQCALQHRLGEDLPPAQVRCALAAAIARSLDAPGTYDAEGWPTIGLCGHQPALGERYISTGSLYLASTAFLPLGLPPDDPFWADDDQPWTARRIWQAGEDLPADHAL